MSELVATRIREHAERLRLAHLAEGLDGLVDRAEQQTMGYLDFLDLVLEEEVGVREGRRFRNALKLSGLPHHKGLDTFDFAFQPELDARKVRDLAALGFVQARANVCFLGPPGVGKTMLASPRSCRPTSNPPSWSSTRWAICRWPGPTPTWSSSWSPAATNAARSC